MVLVLIGQNKTWEAGVWVDRYMIDIELRLHWKKNFPFVGILRQSSNVSSILAVNFKEHWDIAVLGNVFLCERTCDMLVHASRENAGVFKYARLDYLVKNILWYCRPAVLDTLALGGYLKKVSDSGNSFFEFG